MVPSVPQIGWYSAVQRGFVLQSENNDQRKAAGVQQLPFSERTPSGNRQKTVNRPTVHRQPPTVGPPDSTGW